MCTVTIKRGKLGMTLEAAAQSLEKREIVLLGSFIIANCQFPIPLKSSQDDSINEIALPYRKKFNALVAIQPDSRP
jgi:hypothetical protein